MDVKEGLYKIKKQLLNGICDLSAGARSIDIHKNIVISSYPRSGSTWVAELINELPSAALLWEPLHLRNVSEFRELGFGWRQCIPEDQEWKGAEETFEKLFRGELLNFWLSSRDFPLKFCRADRMIIKFVRANGMLSWLTTSFNFQKPPIYLLRHPFAVAASQMKEGSWDYEFSGYEIPDMPFNEIYKKHEPFLSTIGTKPEAMVADWCINNKIVLENKRNNVDWITVYYESLLLNPEKELQRIFDRWNRAMPEDILKKVRVASSTTTEQALQKDVKAQLSKWRKYFDQDEILRLQRVLDYFEIDIYSSSLLPKSMVEKEKLLFG